MYRTYIVKLENNVYIGKTKQPLRCRMLQHMRNDKRLNTQATPLLLKGATMEYIDPLPHSCKGNEERDLILHYQRDYRYNCVNKMVPGCVTWPRHYAQDRARDLCQHRRLFPQKLEKMHKKLAKIFKK